MSTELHTTQSSYCFLRVCSTEVIDCLYDKLSSDDTRLCLMFLDAGHQFEALLDVMLVLGVADSGVLLSNGCQEILSECRCTYPVLLRIVVYDNN